METKTFKEILSINVNDKVEQKSGLNYLSWSYAWAEIKKLDPSANYTIHENSDGNAFFESKFGIDVKVSVQFQGVSHTMRLPVMDGANKSMKAEPYKYSTKYGEKSVEAASAFDINKAIMRCLVKAVAMHGLGLYIYSGEDLPETDKDTSTEIITKKKDWDNHEISLDKTGDFHHSKVGAFGQTQFAAKELKELGFKFFKDGSVWKCEHNSTVFEQLPKVKGIEFKRL